MTMLTNAEPTPRGSLLLAFTLTAVLLAAGLVGLWPVIVESHRRVPPWEVPLLWLSEITALVVFTRLAILHGLLGRPLRDRPRSGARWAERWPAVALLVAWGGDCAVTLLHAREEYTVRHSTQKTARGEIYDYYRIPFRAEGDRPGGWSYCFRYRFQDEDGRWHTGGETAHLYMDGTSAESFPPEVLAGFRACQRPLPVTVRYDPDWPARHWVAGVRRFAAGQPFLFSIASLVLQGLLLPVFVGAYWGSLRNGIIPWWRDLLDALPVMLGAPMLAFAAFAYRATLATYGGNCF